LALGLEHYRRGCWGRRILRFVRETHSFSSHVVYVPQSQVKMFSYWKKLYYIMSGFRVREWTATASESEN
jgi:hypothetical protein